MDVTFENGTSLVSQLGKYTDKDVTLKGTRILPTINSRNNTMTLNFISLIRKEKGFMATYAAVKKGKLENKFISHTCIFFKIFFKDYDE